MLAGGELYSDNRGIAALQNQFHQKEQWGKIHFLTLPQTSIIDNPTEIGWIHKPYKGSSALTDFNAISEKNEINVKFLSPSEQIQFIRETLSLNMSQIAELIEITRPTVYRWLDGKESDRGETASRIINLAEKTKSIRDKNIPRVDLLIKRPLFGGKSILDLLKKNKDISHELDELKSIGNREEKTRQNSRNPKTKNNILKAIDAADELSTPIYFDEEVQP